MRDELWDEVWEELHGVCVLCLRPASSIHEIIPRSKLPKSALLDKENRVTLCQLCHAMVEDQGSANFIQLLRSCRAKVVALFNNA